METKINIAAILKDKPVNTKLYSPFYGNCILAFPEDMTIKDKSLVNSLFLRRWKRLSERRNNLFPSKEMRDWSKFAWKKGDVLVSNDGKIEVIFEKFRSDTYQSFIGKHHLDSLDGNLYYLDEGEYPTFNFNIETEDVAQSYINTIEKRLGGKLNLETLEIEKSQPEFKDGDIVVTDAVPSMCYSKCILILKEDLNTGENSANSYVFYNINNAYINFNVLDTMIRDHNIHLATNEEKQQLFSALAKENKAWDAEKKQIVDFKPKMELKPFDKVLVRDSTSDKWRANLFGYIDRDGYYRCVYANWIYCIPYEGNESLLGTTKDVEG